MNAHVFQNQFGVASICHCDIHCHRFSSLPMEKQNQTIHTHLPIPNNNMQEGFAGPMEGGDTFRSNLDHLVWLASFQAPLPEKPEAVSPKPSTNPEETVQPKVSLPESPVMSDARKGMHEGTSYSPTPIVDDANATRLEPVSYEDTTPLPEKRTSRRVAARISYASSTDSSVLSSDTEVESSKAPHKSLTRRRASAPSVTRTRINKKRKPRYRCPVGSCTSIHPRHFELGRHLIAVHCPDSVIRPHRCHYPDCLSSFVDHERLMQHVMRHAGREAGRPLSGKHRLKIRTEAEKWIAETESSLEAWETLKVESVEWTSLSSLVASSGAVASRSE